MRPLTVGSLFAGIGGFDLGLERAGFEIKWQVEIDPFCRAVLAKHWPDVRRYEDVRTVGAELERVDVICGGFPCQPVSWAGQRLIEFDGRWLWPEIERIARIIRPSWLVLENVRGLLAGGGMDAVIRDLAGLGMDAEWRVLRADRFGAWHRRDRVFILAHPSGVRSTGDSQFLWLEPEESCLQSGYWETTLVPPRFQRVVDGIPEGLDRLEACGNAVVPQIAEWIGRRILEAEAATVTTGGA